MDIAKLAENKQFNSRNYVPKIPRFILKIFLAGAS